MTSTGESGTAADLQGWIDRLSQAALSGERLDLAGSGPVDAANAQSWGPDRCIPAAALRHVLSCGGAVDPRGLQISGARFRESLNLAHIDFPHPLHFTNCAFDGPLDLSGATVKELRFDHSDTQEIQLDNAEIAGDVFAEHLTTHGEFRAVGANIGGQLVITDAKLRNRIAEAADLDALDANALGPDQVDVDALSLDDAHVAEGVFGKNLDTKGSVRANWASIGSLDLEGADLRWGIPESLNLGGTKIAGRVFAAGLKTTRAVRAPEVSIGGELVLTGAVLGKTDNAVAAGIPIVGGYSLSLRGAEIGTDVDAAGLEAAGEIRAPGARIGGAVNLHNAKLCNQAGGNTINFESASIKRLILKGVHNQGAVRLYRASITDLQTSANPPAPLLATGWEVTDIDGPLRSDWVAARRWLETTTETSVQPWHALATVYERNGQPAEGRRLRFAAANRVAKNAPWRTKLMLTAYRYLVGHGYYPLRAFWWLVGVVLVATLIVAANSAEFVPTNSDAAAKAYTEQTHKPPPSRITAQASCHLHLNYPCPNPFTYTLSAVVPTFGNMTSDWTIPSDATNWLTIALPMLKLTAWALTALLAAGVTGILRKT
jgi:uncharacterized protein YjbI with pentapeptide repeats